MATKLRQNADYLNETLRYRFKIRTDKSWPTVTTYYKYISEAMAMGDLQRIPLVHGEGHVWWLLTHSPDDPNEARFITDTATLYKYSTFGKILRAAIMAKYTRLTHYYTRSKDRKPVVQKRFLLKIFAGTSFPSNRLMQKISEDLGFTDVFDMVKQTLDKAVEEQE